GNNHRGRTECPIKKKEEAGRQENKDPQRHGRIRGRTVSDEKLRAEEYKDREARLTRRPKEREGRPRQCNGGKGEEHGHRYGGDNGVAPDVFPRSSDNSREEERIIGGPETR